MSSFSRLWLPLMYSSNAMGSTEFSLIQKSECFFYKASISVTTRVRLRTLTINAMHDGMSSISLDVRHLLCILSVYTDAIQTLLGETAAHMATEHPDYARLAGRLSVTSLYKTTASKFSHFVNDNDKIGELHMPMVHLYTHSLLVGNSIFSDDFTRIVAKNETRINSAIVHGRDSDLN